MSNHRTRTTPTANHTHRIPNSPIPRGNRTTLATAHHLHRPTWLIISTVAHSALRPTGGTQTWRHLRARFAWHLANIGPLPCIKGGQPITATDDWDLGHRIDRVLGGTDDDGVGPEHRHATPGCCEGNRPAGARLGNQLRAQRRAGHLEPSRDW